MPTGPERDPVCVFSTGHGPGTAVNTLRASLLSDFDFAFEGHTQTDIHMMLHTLRVLLHQYITICTNTHINEEQI